MPPTLFLGMQLAYNSIKCKTKGTKEQERGKYPPATKCAHDFATGAGLLAIVVA